MKKYRLIQLITGFHSIHHITYSFGIKLPFLEIAYFKRYGFKKLGKTLDVNNNPMNNYHNRTWANKY